jgi:hypothetical protein
MVGLHGRLIKDWLDNDRCRSRIDCDRTVFARKRGGLGYI